MKNIDSPLPQEMERTIFENSLKLYAGRNIVLQVVDSIL